MLIIQNGKEMELTGTDCASIKLLIFLTRQIFCFYFQNCSNSPLIKNSLKVKCTVEACRT